MLFGFLVPYETSSNEVCEHLYHHAETMRKSAPEPPTPTRIPLNHPDHPRDLPAPPRDFPKPLVHPPNPPSMHRAPTSAELPHNFCMAMASMQCPSRTTSAYMQKLEDYFKGKLLHNFCIAMASMQFPRGAYAEVMQKLCESYAEVGARTSHAHPNRPQPPRSPP